MPTRPPEPNASSRPICKDGYVWREAHRNDFACVTPESRARVAWENRHWIVHTLQGGNACASGFVWRAAFVGDLLCVSAEVRAAVREENRLAPSRSVAAHPASCADVVAPAYVGPAPGRRRRALQGRPRCRGGCRAILPGTRGPSPALTASARIEQRGTDRSPFSRLSFG